MMAPVYHHPDHSKKCKEIKSKSYQCDHLFECGSKNINYREIAWMMIALTGISFLDLLENHFRI